MKREFRLLQLRDNLAMRLVLLMNYENSVQFNSDDAILQEILAFFVEEIPKLLEESKIAKLVKVQQYTAPLFKLKYYLDMPEGPSPYLLSKRSGGIWSSKRIHKNTLYVEVEMRTDTLDAYIQRRKLSGKKRQVGED